MPKKKTTKAAQAREFVDPADDLEVAQILEEAGPAEEVYELTNAAALATLVKVAADGQAAQQLDERMQALADLMAADDAALRGEK